MFDWLRRMFRNPGGENPDNSPDHSAEPDTLFTRLASRVMELAACEAHRRNHEYIGTEHILLALIQVEDSVAVTVLKKCDISIEGVRQVVERSVQHGPGGEPVIIGKLPQTPRTTSSLRWASEEARFLAHDFVCTEHLLMGLLRETEGVAAEVLRQMGLTADRARDEVIRLSPPGRGPR